MHLKKLGLRYFRSYDICSLDLTGQPVVFFGNNGAGKTNILEAVSLLTPGRGLRRAKLSDFARQPDNLGWQIIANLSKDNLHIQTGINLKHLDTQRTTLVEQEPVRINALSQYIRMIWLTPAMDRLWIEEPAGRRRFLDRMTLSFFPEHARYSTIYEKSLRARNMLLREQRFDTRWCAALEVEMAKAAYKIITARQQTVNFIMAAQANTPTSFPIADLKIDDHSPQNIQDFWADTRARDHAARRTLMGPHRTDLQAFYKTKSMPAALCSTGEQKALLMSIVLANVRALIDYTRMKPLVLLDEVAAHFDPVRREELFDEICHLGVQAWMTGTDETMFRTLHTRAQLIHIDASTGASTSTVVHRNYN